MKKVEELPEETRTIVMRLIKKGFIVCIDDKVKLTDEMAELLLILDRADIFN